MLPAMKTFLSAETANFLQQFWIVDLVGDVSDAVDEKFLTQ